MDIESLREHVKTRLAQADAENGGKATRDQQADYLLSWIGVTKTPERVTREVPNPRFGKPGEYPRMTQEAATLSDLIAFLVGMLATEGDLPIVLRGFSPYAEGYEESAVWRRTDANVVRDEDKRFDWASLVYEVGPTYGRVDGLPRDVPAINLETEG